MRKSINTYGYLYSASVSTSKAGQNAESGSFYQYMASLIFSAFTLEAYLNHLGELTFSYWKQLEVLKPISKLEILSEVTGAHFDKGQRPYQTVSQLFRFRNEMAHGKSQFCAQPGKDNEPWWLDFCTEKNAERAREDVEVIIVDLNEKSGIRDPWTFNHESY